MVLVVGVKPYFELIRPPNCAMSGVGAVLATLVYLEYRVLWSHVVLLVVGFLTGFALTACAMIVNDLVDIEVDRVNKPWRPLPRGAVSTRRALALALALGVLGVLVNTATRNALLVLVALIYGVLGVAYSFMRRHWWSHTLVALSTTGPVVYGYVAASTPLSKLELAALFSLVVFFATMGREILKAVQDYRGDAERGYSTLATKYGVETALRAMLATGLTASLLAAISTAVLRTGLLYKTLILVTALLYTHSLLRAYKNPTPLVLEESRKRTLLAMSLGLLAFWLSGL